MQTEALAQAVFAEKRDAVICTPHPGDITDMLCRCGGCMVFISPVRAQLQWFLLHRPYHRTFFLFLRGMEADAFASDIEALSTAIDPVILLQPELLTDARLTDCLFRLPVDTVVIPDALRASWKNHRFSPMFALIPAFVRRHRHSPSLLLLSVCAPEEVLNAAAELLAMQNPYRLIIPPVPGQPHLQVLTCRTEEERKEWLLRLAMEENADLFCCRDAEEACRVYEALSVHPRGAHLLHENLSDAELQAGLRASADGAPIAVSADALPLLLPRKFRHAVFPSMPDAMTDCAGLLLSLQSPGCCDGTILYQSADLPHFLSRTLAHLTGGEYPIEDRAALHTVIDAWCGPAAALYEVCCGRGCLYDALLKAAGYPAVGFCGRCSSCDPPGEFADVTEDARMVLGAVRASGETLSASLLVHVLRDTFRSGRNAALFAGFPYRGRLADRPSSYVHAIINRMLFLEILCPAPGVTRGSLHSGCRAGRILSGDEAFYLPQEEAGPLTPGEAAVLGLHADRRLTEALRVWRSDAARQDGVPTYMVFGNLTLHALSALRPDSLDALSRIPRMPRETVRWRGRAILALLAQIPKTAPDADAVSAPPRNTEKL